MAVNRCHHRGVRQVVRHRNDAWLAACQEFDSTMTFSGSSGLSHARYDSKSADQPLVYGRRNIELSYYPTSSDFKAATTAEKVQMLAVHAAWCARLHFQAVS
jgi:hypothetical protein